MQIREFEHTSEDYNAVVHVMNTVWRESIYTADDLRRDDQERPPQLVHRRFVAEVDEQIVGFGSFAHNEKSYHRQRFWVHLDVLPDWRQRGIGTQLYDNLLAIMQAEYSANELHTDRAGLSRPDGGESVLRRIHERPVSPHLHIRALPRQGKPSFFETFRYEKKPKGVGLQFSIGERTYTLFDRYRYESKIEDLNKRPAYSFDAGREHVFELETDAYSAVTIQEKGSTYFCCVDFSTLIHKGRPLFEMDAMDQLQLDFKDPLKRTTSWSNWDDRVQD